MPRVKQGHPEHLPLKRKLRSEMTTAETRLWSRLRAKQFQGLKFRRQHGIGPYIVDFYCPERSLVIEVDGDAHAPEAQVMKDRERDQYLHSLGLQVIRFMNDDVLNNIEGMLEDLYEKLSRSTSPHPSLQRRGQRTRP